MQVKTIKYLKGTAPAALATEPSKTVSDIYQFIPTTDIVDALLDEGWDIHEAKQSFSRRSKVPFKFRKHEIAFTNKAVTSKAQRKVGDIMPRVILSNAHDGSAQARLRAGLFRLICSNGMEVGEGLVQAVGFRHVGHDIEEVLEAAEAYRSNVDRIVRHIVRFKEFEMTPAAAVEFARQAINLRHDRPDFTGVVAIEDILRPRRNEDAGNRLWEVFNRVQESIIKGGYPIYKQQPTAWTQTQARPIKGIDDSSRINTALWDLAEDFTKN